MIKKILSNHQNLSKWKIRKISIQYLFMLLFIFSPYYNRHLFDNLFLNDILILWIKIALLNNMFNWPTIDFNGVQNVLLLFSHTFLFIVLRHRFIHLARLGFKDLVWYQNISQKSVFLFFLHIISNFGWKSCPTHVVSYIKMLEIIMYIAFRFEVCLSFYPYLDNFYCGFTQYYGTFWNFGYPSVWPVMLRILLFRK